MNNDINNNSRVVAYIKEEISYQVIKNLMGGDLMSEVWLKLGHTGTRRTLVGFIYREQKPWKSRDDSVQGQEERLKVWLEARRPLWSGVEETHILGNFYLDWRRQGDPKYRNSKMLKKNWRKSWQI